MNLDIWNKLSKEDQNIIKEACMNQSLKSFEEASNEDAKYMKMMSDAGIKVIVPTDEQLTKIATMARKQVWPVMEDIIGKEIMNQMRKHAGL
jgi:TRAP-type C4-dicarboxylate transport system substrate-binding protein